MRGLKMAGLLLCLSATLSCRQLLDIEDAEPLPDDTDGSVAGVGGGSSAPLSAGGAPSAGAESTAAGGSEDERVPPLCEQYCEAVETSCRGAFAVYTSRQTCLAVCAALPEGEPGDASGNSIACRLRAAGLARDEVAHYCPIAGPGGNGVCGSNCEGLCRLRAGICAQFVTNDEAACVAACEALPDLGAFSTDTSQAQYSGPHVQCRLYHVSAATVTDAEQHCGHVDGAAPCD